MGVKIYSFNFNISPKMSYGVLECEIVVTESHAYDFVMGGGALFVPDPVYRETGRERERGRFS